MENMWKQWNIFGNKENAEKKNIRGWADGLARRALSQPPRLRKLAGHQWQTWGHRGPIYGKLPGGRVEIPRT